MRIPLTVVSLLALATALGGDLDAAAIGQGVTIPGQSCWAGHYNRHDHLNTNVGAKNDNATYSRPFWCPAKLGGESSSGQSRDIDWGRVTIYDRSTTTAVSCIVYARTRSATRYYSAGRNSGTSFTGFKTMTWTSSPINGGAPIGTMETLGLRCYLPKKASTTARSAIVGGAIGYTTSLPGGIAISL